MIVTRISANPAHLRRFGGGFLPYLASRSLSLELADFGADVRMQVLHPAVVNPIQRDAVGGELERLLAEGVPAPPRRYPRSARRCLSAAPSPKRQHQARADVFQ